MGRGQEAPQPPSFSPSEVKYGDTTVSKTYLNPSGAIVTEYVPDPAELASKQQAQAQINQIIPTLGKTAPELSAQFDQTKQAFINDATQSFQDTYDPALKSLKEDIASRFGTLNSSEFLSGLNSLEKNRANALADIATKAESVKADLVNQDEARKLNEIQALGGVLSADQTNFLNDTKSSLTASQSLSDFLNSQWMEQLRNYTSQQNSKRQMIASIVSSVANAGARVASAGMG